jgi:hypothetical protein
MSSATKDHDKGDAATVKDRTNASGGGGGALPLALSTTVRGANS